MSCALVVEHIEQEGSGAFAEWLPAAGLDLDHHLVQRDGPVPTALDPAYDALVVMGGAMGVGDAALHEWMAYELALLRQAVADGTPVLGVCLGAQMLAAACGGSVVRGRVGPELGLGRVHLNDAAQADPLLGGVPPVVNAVQWHWDEVLTLPTGAMLLASSPAYPHQAFRVNRAWGVQFHPEAMPSNVRRWAAEDEREVREAGEDPSAHVRDVEEAWPELEHVWRTVAERFAHLVQDGA